MDAGVGYLFTHVAHRIGGYLVGRFLCILQRIAAMERLLQNFESSRGVIAMGWLDDLFAKEITCGEWCPKCEGVCIGRVNHAGLHKCANYDTCGTKWSSEDE